MSLTVTQRPNQNGVWVAAKNPIIYKMTRNDFTWTTLVNSSGNTSIQIATNVTASFVAGDTIWLQSDHGDYSASGTVVSSAFGAATTVITTVPYVANNSAGYINIISRRPNYYVGVGVYKKTDNTLIGTVNYYPTIKGLLTIDVSAPILSILDPSLDSIVDGIIIQDSNPTEGFYIKYTEFWTGSGNSAINDVSNISYSILGAKQIGQDSYYASYVGLLPLTKLDYSKLFTNEYFCLSYISETGGNIDNIKKSWYDYSGTLLYSTFIKSHNNTHAYDNTPVPPSVYTLIQKFSLTESIYPDRNITLGTDVAWSANSVTLLNGEFSKAWSFPFFLPNTVGTVSFTGSVTISGNSTNVDVYFILIDSNGAAIHFATDILVTGSNGTYSGTKIVNNVYSTDAAFIGIAVSNFSGADKTITLNSLTATPNNQNIGRIDFKGIKLYNSFIPPVASWSNTGSGTSWSSGVVNLSGTFTTSKFWATALTISPGEYYSFNYDVTIASSVNYLRFVTLDASNTIKEVIIEFVSSDSGTVRFFPTFAATQIAVVAQSDDAGGTERVTLTTLNFSTEILFNTISGFTNSCAQNSITLFWRNSLGGESSWTFNYSQDQVQKLQDPFKNKWLTLYDQNLTLSQFNSLNELFSVNQNYQTPIVELTTSIDKTEAKVGQQVYTVDTNGNKIGVIVIGGENKTRTRNKRHSFQVTIELPEIFG